MPYRLLDTNDLSAASNRSLGRIQVGQDEAAVTHLRAMLATVDAATAPIHDALMDATGLFAAHAPADVDEATVLAFAAYHYRAGLVLFGPDHPRSLHAAVVLADALHRYANYGASLAIRDTAIAGYSRCGDHYQHAEQRFAYADTLHTTGRCAAATAYAQQALTGWLPHGTDEPMTGPVLLVRLVDMLHVCGRPNDARVAIYDHLAVLPATGSKQRTDIGELADILLRDQPARQQHRTICTARSTPSAARTGGFRPATTSDLIALLGSDPRPPRASPGTWRTAQVRNDVIDRYTARQQSLRTIARALGCAQETVRTILLDAQVTMRPAARTRRTAPDAAAYPTHPPTAGPPTAGPTPSAPGE